MKFYVKDKLNVILTYNNPLSQFDSLISSYLSKMWYKFYYIIDMIYIQYI